MIVLNESIPTREWSARLDNVVTASRMLAETSPTERARLLRSIGASIEQHTDALVPIAVEETGLGVERLAGEVARTVNQFRLSADVMEEGSWTGVSIDRVKPPFDDHRRMNVSVGPVLVFAASNFPFAFGVLGTDTASALAAGCAVVAKPHPGHPRLALRLAAVMGEALGEAGFPEELFTLVTGNDASVQVLRDDRIEAGSFTGSIDGGRALLAIAQARPRPIPFFAEMGSTNPVIVTAAAWEARREEILNGLIGSMTQSNGQLCTSPGVVFVPTDLVNDIKLGELMAAATSAPMLTDAIAHTFNSGLVALSATPGVEPLSQVRVFTDRAAQPVIWRSTTAAVEANPAILEELFGPSSFLIAYDSLARLLEVIDKLDGQLTASIFSENGEDISALSTALARKVGRLLNNAWPTGVAVSWSMHHGGPWPSSSSSAYGSVGAESIFRFVRPVVYQNFPESSLPSALQNANPWNLPRRLNGHLVGASQ